MLATNFELLLGGLDSQVRFVKLEHLVWRLVFLSLFFWHGGGHTFRGHFS